MKAIFKARTTSIIYRNSIEAREGVSGSTGSATVDCHWKSMESWV